MRSLRVSRSYNSDYTHEVKPASYGSLEAINSLMVKRCKQLPALSIYQQFPVKLPEVRYSYFVHLELAF